MDHIINIQLHVHAHVYMYNSCHNNITNYTSSGKAQFIISSLIMSNEPCILSSRPIDLSLLLPVSFRPVTASL